MVRTASYVGCCCRCDVFELPLWAHVLRRRRRQRQRRRSAGEGGRSVDDGVTTSARRLHLHDCVVAQLHRLRYNRDKIVYTCAIVANIRGDGGDVWRQVGRELGGFSFTACATHLIWPWAAWTVCRRAAGVVYDTTSTFPQHASLDIYTLISAILCHFLPPTCHLYDLQRLTYHCQREREVLDCWCRGVGVACTRR